MIRILTALAILLAPTAASAKPAAPDSSVLTLIRPYEEKDVPLDTRIWVDKESATQSIHYATPRRPQLYGPDDVVVPLGEPTEIVAVGGTLLVYTPLVPLAPYAIYKLLACTDVICSEQLATFTTVYQPDDGPPLPPDHDAPAPPDIWELYRTPEGSLYIEAGFADDILVIGDEQATEEPLVSGTLVAAGTTSHGLNLRSHDIPTDRLRFATYDLAGNFSGWTPPRATPENNPGTNDCSTTTPAPWYLLLPFLRRRRPTP